MEKLHDIPEWMRLILFYNLEEFLQNINRYEVRNMVYFIILTLYSANIKKCEEQK